MGLVQKRAGKVLAMMKGGHLMFLGSFNAGHLSFSHSEGGCKKLPPL